MARKAPPITEKQLNYIRILQGQTGITIQGDLESLTKWNGIALIDHLKDAQGMPSSIEHTLTYMRQDFPGLTFTR